jgi:DNA modification methylase
VAFALQSDGWYLRSDIIWHKPNPMPESVTDRPTKAHEYLFLLSKNDRYYYDAEAIRDQISESQIGRVRSDVIGGKSWLERNQHGKGGCYEKGFAESGTNGGTLALFGECREREGIEGTRGTPLCKMPEMVRFDEENRRNKRSVWTVPTAPYSGAHFATYPPDLIKPCILAGSRPGDTILDPFAGSGTTGMVAIELARKAILIELNANDIKLIERRCATTVGLGI